MSRMAPRPEVEIDARVALDGDLSLELGHQRSQRDLICCDHQPVFGYWGSVDVQVDIDVAANDKPAYLQEQALVDFFASRSDEVGKRIGRQIDLANQKPYTGTHNAGYTECQEFYGAITLNSEEPLGRRIVTMLDVAIRGVGNMWNEVIIPGLDYVVVEKTLGKYDQRVETLTKLPINLQHLVGGRT